MSARELFTFFVFYLRARTLQYFVNCFLWGVRCACMYVCVSSNCRYIIETFDTMRVEHMRDVADSPMSLYSLNSCNIHINKIYKWMNLSWENGVCCRRRRKKEAVTKDCARNATMELNFFLSAHSFAACVFFIFS